MSELATANPAALDVAGSDSAAPSDALDNPYNADFRELEEEEQANPEPEQRGTETDRETDEANGGQEAASETDVEAGKAEDQPSEEGDKDAKSPDDAVVVTMPDGQRLELKELKSGYMRDRDYRHKTTELANQRRDLAAMSSRVNDTVNAMSELLLAQVPKRPDPSLSVTDPLAFVQQQAAHEAGMATLNDIVQRAATVRGVQDTLTQEQAQAAVQSELAKLEQAFPQTRTQEGKAKFAQAAVSAAKELGFTDAELQGMTDHRMLAVAYYADLGLKAEKARKTATRKVENVPPVPPQKQRGQTGANASRARASQEAMKRLERTGSIADAMGVDFD